MEHYDKTTVKRLEIYKTLVEKWQRAINLVAPSTLPHLWERHFEDSLQLLPLIPSDAQTLLDLGSGAGFPGMVLAIASSLDVTLVDSDLRKCEFLKNVSRGTFSNVMVLNGRIESLEPTSYDVITSRALAPLDLLLDLSLPFCSEKTILLFLKGERLNQELEKAQDNWLFSREIIPSKTSSQGSIIKITHLKRGNI